MKNTNIEKWPNSFKASIVFGIGCIAAESAFIAGQVVDTVEATPFENVCGVAIAVAGGWRIAEPILGMRLIKKHNDR